MQAELAKRRRRSGAVPVGRKIGLTSEAVQRQLGVDQPDFGVLFDDMAHADGQVADLGRLLQPRVEAEIAFILAHDLEGDVDADRVHTSVAYAVAALEIVDSRVASWDISITDTIADNGSSGLFVLGSRRMNPTEFEPRSVQMTMRVNGSIASTGSGAACLGDPLAALDWLARTAQRIGEPLRQGEVVLSGALGPVVDVRDGDLVQAEIGDLGTVAVSLATKECDLA